MSLNQPTILVTGGAGYVGSHTVLALKQAGYKVLVLDNLVNGHRDLVETVLKVELITGDICDRALLDHIFATRTIIAVIHFAAFAYVGESMVDPAPYYRNNVAGTLTLLEAMLAASIYRIVFSSTCATYGIPAILPIPEDHPQAPINPYGTSKLMVERMLAEFDNAYNLRSVCFRYFNRYGSIPRPLGRMRYSSLVGRC
ncbi:MAG: NAD-dependent epimerase/dehydratase family protein [Leptolyngbyaceae cyanobacterium bins.302]|nr:NAD-dependent epimerase/dehydratase family protein [Leptolyngbyaceae cyanobacterium bins.302]